MLPQHDHTPALAAARVGALGHHKAGMGCLQAALCKRKGSAVKPSLASQGCISPASRLSWERGCSSPAVPALGSAGLGGERVTPSRHVVGNNPVRNACLSWLPDKGQGLSC